MSLFLTKLQVFRPATLLKRDSSIGVIPVNIAKFSSICERLLLTMSIEWMAQWRLRTTYLSLSCRLSVYYTPWKYQKTKYLWFCDVFRGCRKRLAPWNRVSYVWGISLMPRSLFRNFSKLELSYKSFTFVVNIELPFLILYSCSVNNTLYLPLSFSLSWKSFFSMYLNNFQKFKYLWHLLSKYLFINHLTLFQWRNIFLYLTKKLNKALLGLVW